MEALINYENEKEKLRSSNYEKDENSGLSNKKSNKKLEQIARERLDLRNMERLLQKQKRMEQMMRERQAVVKSSKEGNNVREPSKKVFFLIYL